MPRRIRAEKYSASSPTMVEVFCRYVRRNGKIIYPKKAKFFHFWVKK